MTVATLRKIEVTGGFAVEDGEPPQVLLDQEGRVVRAEPALVAQGTPLRLRLELRGDQPPVLSGAVRGEGIELPLRFPDEPARQEGAWSLDAVTEPLPRGVTVHELQVELASGGLPCRGAPAPLRLYATYARPRKNTPHPSRLPHAGKVHLEHACRWAQGASRLTAYGPDSIPHCVDNAMRHYVHPGQGHASAYGDLPPPLNYERLPGHEGIRAGERPLSPLWIPIPPWVSDEDYRAHYAGNFGWQVLDNPTHPGGRCSQQASLLCEILGTLGIEARVVLLERTATVRRGYRRVAAYQAFRARDFGDQWWDSHGLAEVPLEDGALHYYDGSFSEPQGGPGRTHGTRQEAFAARSEDPRGLFIHTWGPWLYREDEAEVPRRNWPDRWSGVP